MPTETVFFPDDQLEQWLAEDIGILDLTSRLLGLGEQPANIQWHSRAPLTAACTEEAARIVVRCGGVVRACVPSATQVQAGEPLLDASGPAMALLHAWKVCQNLLEHACGIATQTQQLVRIARAANPAIGIFTTRKHPPGLRRIAIKATLAGGAMPHRLGLSETVVIFPQHLALLPGGWQALRQRLQQHRPDLLEKRIVIEASTLEEAQLAICAGADIIQFDKATPAQLRQWCPLVRASSPVRILAAGGIRADNVSDYAASGVDGLVTSSLYYAPPADIGVRIHA